MEISGVAIMENDLIVSKAEAMNPSRRNTMEDACVTHFPGTWNCNDPELAYFGVYDGHGGRDTVDFLEEALHGNIAQELNMDDNTSIHNKLERAFLITDAESKMSGIQTSGATVAICLIQKHSCGKKVTITAANVGDARAVLSCQPRSYTKACTSCDGELYPSPKSKRLRSKLVQSPKSFRLTYDHKSDDKDEIKRIEDAGGFVMKNRVLGIMAVARSLGDHGMKEFVIGRPYVNTVEISLSKSGSKISDDRNDGVVSKSSSEFVIIGCDGVWDVIEDQEAVDLVRKYGSSRCKETAAKMLCRLALQRGSTDNVSVLVIWF